MPSGPSSSAAGGSGKPSGSSASPGGRGNGSWGMHHRPFRRKIRNTPYEQYSALDLKLFVTYEYLFKILFRNDLRHIGRPRRVMRGSSHGRNSRIHHAAGIGGH